MGDSTNDQLMFEHFPLQRGRGQPAALCGAAAHLARLITAAERGRLRPGGATPAGASAAHERARRPGIASAAPALAAALALAAAVSLGLARFAYALLLPPMRADLGWSYLTAGAMNTVNAAGYLVGALLVPRLLRRFDARA